MDVTECPFVPGPGRLHASGHRARFVGTRLCKVSELPFLIYYKLTFC